MSFIKNLINKKTILLSGSILTGSGVFYHYSNKKKYYTFDQISDHDMENDIWVEHKGKVYDITKFIDNHPGGKDKVMMAAGASITPYWDIYKQHNEPIVEKILSDYHIGYLDPTDNIQDNITDEYNPYIMEPKRLSLNKIHKKEPFNSETHEKNLINNYITPLNYWFVRNHHPVPFFDPDKYNIIISGKGINTLKLSLDDIKNKYPKHEIINTIQCAGNRRKELNEIEPTFGLGWNIGAISTAKWGGVYLSDILKELNYNKENYTGNEHIHFIGEDSPFATSISIKDFLKEDVEILLAYEMNNKDLSPDNGYPLRIIVPGFAGSKNIKWIKSIIISDKENDSNWQSGIAYKKLPNTIKSVKDIDMTVIKNIPTVEKMPIQSFICYPLDNQIIKLSDDELIIKGIAYCGGGKNISKVEVSCDGKNWFTANLKEGSEQENGKAWAWTFWEYKFNNIKPLPGTYNIMVRAENINKEKQPDNILDIWNLRGILNNSYHKIIVKVI